MAGEISHNILKIGVGKYILPNISMFPALGNLLRMHCMFFIQIYYRSNQ